MELENLEYLSRVIKKEIDAGKISGAAICVLHENKQVFRKEYGLADIEKERPIKQDTIYRMFSMTKPVTAVAAMILFERGELNLLSPVSDYLEGFKNQEVWTDNGLVELNRSVTIQDLLNMTSGVVYPDGSFEVGRQMGALYDEAARLFEQDTPLNTVDFCNHMGQVPLAFQPGDHWHYSASADVLGAVIEVASGKRFSEFLREEIFTPLGMVDTDFYVPDEKMERFAQMYDYIEDKKQLEPFRNYFLGLYHYESSPAFESGGAGLVSTIDDYARFALMLANNGVYNGVRILGKKSVDYLGVPQLTKEQAATYNWDSISGYSYGNLMRILVDPVKAGSNGTIGEFGWDGWAGNYFMVDRKENLVMLYMIQRCGGTNPNLMRRLRANIYGAI
ncbi:MAG: serine hydrolase domain-containing protein [Mobilitalea sp.]